MREIGIRIYRYVNYRLAIAGAITISLPILFCSKNIMTYPDRCYTFTESNTHLFHTQHAKHLQTTLARIGYLPPDGLQVTLKGADNVKIDATYFTNQPISIPTHITSARNKVHTLAACIFHVINNRETSRWK